MPSFTRESGGTLHVAVMGVNRIGKQRTYKWADITPPQHNDIASIGQNQMIAVGFDGTIVRSEDGGKTWNAVASGTNNFLGGVHFADPQTAIAVGDGGMILNGRPANSLNPLEFPAEKIEEKLRELKTAISDSALDPLPKRIYLTRSDVFLSRATQIAAEITRKQNDVSRVENDIRALGQGGSTTGRRLDDPIWVSTQITRIGSIVLILFLVQILVALYRYNTRLAAFYDARADLIIMVDRPLILLEKADALTPGGVDFTKGIQSAASDMKDFISALMRRG